MTSDGSRRLAWTIWGLTVGLAALGLALGWLNRHASRGSLRTQVVFALALLMFGLVGSVILSRHPRNPVGWILSVGGLLAAVILATDYARYALVTRRGELAGGPLVAWVGDLIWFSGVAAAAPLACLLFPTGRVPSRRWRPIVWVALAGVGLSLLGTAIEPTLYSYPSIRGPFAVRSLDGLAQGLRYAGLAVTAVAAIAAVVSLVVRYGPAQPRERQQIKWFAYSAALTMIAVSATFLVRSSGASATLRTIAALVALTVPISIGIAILRYDLFDIDIVINKTVVFGGLAAFITLVYGGVVVGVGAAVGTRGHPNTVLSVLATAIVAFAFQPVRVRMRGLANQLVYGKRATPYEVMSAFSERMAETFPSEELLPRMAQILAEGTAARQADIWLHIGRHLALAASWPDSGGRDPLPMEDGEVPDITGATATLPVRHQGEVLGALSLTKPPGESMNATEEKLLADLAIQAGLVLRNVRLTSELIARLDELRASRQRLVAAQDAERRRLERDLHDGAQQQLIALAMKVRLAQGMAIRDPQKTEGMLANVAGEAQLALETLRDLAHGIYPAVLTDQGLGAAIGSRVRLLAVPTVVEASNIGRYPPEVEAAAYFCCLEALQNVEKYSRAQHCTVRLEEARGLLRFAVSDDGCGFDPSGGSLGAGLQNMADRLGALGGILDLRSSPGNGTVVQGTIPLEDRRPEGDAVKSAGANVTPTQGHDRNVGIRPRSF